MAKNFNQIAEEIMPLVDSGDKSQPFVVSREKDGGWQVSYPKPFENIDSLLADIKERDPYAAFYYGADFAKRSYPSVYDTLLKSRLYAEFNANWKSGTYSDYTEVKEARAMYNFFSVNIGEFSQKMTDYLTTVEKPLTTLAEMCPYKMAFDDGDLCFNEDLAFDAVHYIENEVSVRLQSYPKTEVKPVLRIIDGHRFAEKQSVEIGKNSVSLSECTGAPSPYLVCCRKNGEDYSQSAFPDYVSAVREFTSRQTNLVKALEDERKARKERGVDSAVLLAKHCLPGSENADFTGKTLIVKANELSPEYKYCDSQLILCTHGSGTFPGKSGRTVFGTELYSGDIVCYGRHQIEGVADEALLPQWAVSKLETIRDKTPKNKEPASLLDELDDARAEAAARSAVQSDKAPTKKRGDIEV